MNRKKCRHNCGRGWRIFFSSTPSFVVSIKEDRIRVTKSEEKVMKKKKTFLFYGFVGVLGGKKRYEEEYKDIKKVSISYPKWKLLKEKVRHVECWLVCGKKKVEKERREKPLKFNFQTIKIEWQQIEVSAIPNHHVLFIVLWLLWTLWWEINNEKKRDQAKAYRKKSQVKSNK